MPEVVALLPPAWQYPEHARGRLTLGEPPLVHAGFAGDPRGSSGEEFRLRDGDDGRHRRGLHGRACPPPDEGPFLHEERELIRSLADMLRAYFQHRQDDAAIVAANERLERQVEERTAAPAAPGPRGLPGRGARTAPASPRTSTTTWARRWP